MLSKFLPSSLCLLALSAPAYGQDCAAIENPVDRLACFDAVAGRPASSSMRFGTWQVLDFNGDPLASTESVEPVQCGQVNGKATLTIDCTAEMPLLYVSVPCRAVNPVGQVLALFQFEDWTMEQTFIPSQDGRSLGTWSNDIQSVRALSDGQVVVSFAGADATLTPATFDLTGYMELRDHLLERECIWNPKAG